MTPTRNEGSQGKGTVIVVTAFGKYASFQDNPSEAVVRRLRDEGIEDVVPGASLHTEVMPVTYKYVETTVSSLWDRFQPHLVIHVGAHPCPRVMKIEQQSFGRGYCAPDMECEVPCNNVCACGMDSSLEEKPADVLVSELNCAQIAQAVTSSLDSDCLTVESSDDPGRYLCAYSYFISLSRDKKRSLFVHVPGFDDQVTEQLVTQALKGVIKECCRQLEKTE